MTPGLVERLAELDNVRYIKESTGDVTRVSQIIRQCGDKITVFCGGDTVTLESYALGARGWVTGAASFLPKECVQLYELAAEQHDYESARDLYYGLLPLLELLENSGKYSQYVKAACEIIGHPVGPPRQPLKPASSDEVTQLRTVLQTITETENDS